MKLFRNLAGLLSKQKPAPEPVRATAPKVASQAGQPKSRPAQAQAVRQPQQAPSQPRPAPAENKGVFSKLWNVLWDDPSSKNAPVRGSAPTAAAPVRPSASVPVGVAVPSSAPARPVAAAPSTGSNLSKVTLPLPPIVEGMPKHLKALSRCRGGETVTLDAQPLIDQLSSGTVKVAFGELRTKAPAGCLSSNTQFDRELVELPLQDIVAKVGQHLPQRRPKKRLEVPEDVGDTFAVPGGARPRTPQPSPARPVEPIAPAPVAPAPAYQAAPEPVVAQPEEMPVIPFKPAAQAAPIPVKAAPPSPKPATAAPLPQQAPRPQQADVEGSLVLALRDLCEGWPETVMQEVASADMAGSSVALPLARLEPGLRAGRIAFTWAEISQWMQPGGLIPQPETEATELELPLQIIAPLFMAQKRGNQARKKVALDQSIPDVFAPTAPQKPVPAPAPAKPAAAAPLPAKAAPAPAPAVAAAAVPKPAPAAPKPVAPADPDSELLTSILRRLAAADWSPQDLATQAARFKGVVGLLIATPDGFLVASEMHGSHEGEQLAALFPQLFSKLNEYFKDLEMGQMSNLRFTVGNSTFCIYKAGELFFAAVGRTGEKLPETYLEQVAATLARVSA